MKTKKIFGLFCGMAAMMSMAACSSEEVTPMNGCEMVTFTAKLPGKFTRGVADGAKANTLVCYVYDSQNNFVVKHEGKMAANEGSVTMRLASGVDYQLVFWSQVKSDNSPYSITDEGVLSVDYTKMNGNDDNNDAFYYTTTFKGGTQPEEGIVLKRPLAQINFGTDDLHLKVVESAYNKNVRTTVSVDAYNTMNLLTGEVSGVENQMVTARTSANLLSDELFPDADHEYLNMAYVLVPKSGITSMMTLKAYNSDDATTPVWSVEVPNAPLKQNFRTNVFGSLLTTKTDFEVTIDGEFDGTTVSAYDIQNLANGSATEVNVALANDLSDQNVVIAESKVAKTVNVDLKGFGAPTFRVGKNVTLNITNTGIIKEPRMLRTRATNFSEEPRVFALAGSVVNIYGGRFVATLDGNQDSNSCIEAAGGEINIYGGIFECQKDYYGKWYVLNLNNSKGGKITVFGGKFKDQDPRLGDDAGTPGITVAEGKTVTVNGDWFVVE